MHKCRDPLLLLLLLLLLLFLKKFAIPPFLVTGNERYRDGMATSGMMSAVHTRLYENLSVGSEVKNGRRTDVLFLINKASSLKEPR
jgi:hypothetical protein